MAGSSRCRGEKFPSFACAVRGGAVRVRGGGSWARGQGQMLREEPHCSPLHSPMHSSHSHHRLTTLDCSTPPFLPSCRNNASTPSSLPLSAPLPARRSCSKRWLTTPLPCRRLSNSAAIGVLSRVFDRSALPLRSASAEAALPPSPSTSTSPSPSMATPMSSPSPLDLPHQPRPHLRHPPRPRHLLRRLRRLRPPPPHHPPPLLSTTPTRRRRRRRSRRSERGLTGRSTRASSPSPQQSALHAVLRQGRRSATA